MCPSYISELNSCVTFVWWLLILHLKMKTRTPLSSEAQIRAACSQFSKKEISFDKMLTEGGVLTSQAPPPNPTSTIFTLQAVQSVHRRQNSHPSWMNSFWLVTMLLMGTKKKKKSLRVQLDSFDQLFKVTDRFQGRHNEYNIPLIVSHCLNIQPKWLQLHPVTFGGVSKFKVGTEKNI